MKRREAVPVGSDESLRGRENKVGVEGRDNWETYRVGGKRH